MGTSGLKRQSNFELYRIICICLIVLMHSFGTGTGTFNTHVGILVNVLGNIGVTGFILLSGYFGINLNFKKLVKIDIMMIVWSLCQLVVTGFVSFLSMPQRAVTIKELVKCFIPFASHAYWFIAAYFALCILSPFINDYLNKTDKKTHKKLIIYAGFIYLLMPTVFFFDQTGDGGKGIVNMILAYIIGRYIGMYHKDEKISLSRLWALFASVVAVNYTLNFIVYHATDSTAYYYARDNSVFTVAQAVILLLIFMQFKMSSKFINMLSANIIAVYVLEDGIKWILNGVFPFVTEFADVPYRILIMLAVTVATFAAASILEALRKLIFGRAEDVIIDWIGNRILSWKKQ